MYSSDFFSTSIFIKYISSLFFLLSPYLLQLSLLISSSPLAPAPALGAPLPRLRLLHRSRLYLVVELSAGRPPPPRRGAPAGRLKVPRSSSGGRAAARRQGRAGGYAVRQQERAAARRGSWTGATWWRGSWRWSGRWWIRGGTWRCSAGAGSCTACWPTTMPWPTSTTWCSTRQWTTTATCSPACSGTSGSTATGTDDRSRRCLVEVPDSTHIVWTSQLGPSGSTAIGTKDSSRASFGFLHRLIPLS